MRSLAPADTLVYLEAGDLGEMLEALTQNKAWENLATEKTDFSRLKNIQVAVVVTGFETSEKQVTDESAILNFKPRFAIIADTHAWESTAALIAENQIGDFIKQTYGDDVKFEKTEKQDAKFFVWTSGDGRKLFSAVSKSIIYVGNDVELLDKCLAVQRGEAKNLSKNENLVQARKNANNENLLAFGYIAPEGITQISNMIGVSLAVEATKEGGARSFIAKNLPAILQKTTKEITWTAQKNERGIEDKIFIKTDVEVSSVFKETLTTGAEMQFQYAEFLPIQFDSITRYNLQNPQIAWRSVLLTASKQVDVASAKILIQVSNSFFEPYGISDGESFLSVVGSKIITARFDEEGEKSVVIANIKDAEKLKKSISEEINFKAEPEKIGEADVWKSKDKTLAAAFVQDKIILGETKSVLDCLKAKESGENFAKTIQYQNSAKSPAVATTVTKDAETAQKIVKVLGNQKEKNKNFLSFFTTETRFSENKIERKTISDFGLIGIIVEKFSE